MTDPLFVADPNSRKSLEAQRKLISAIESSGPQGLGYREWWRRAKVSPATLKVWLPRFLEQRLVIRDSPGRYVFNQKHPSPVTVASFSAKIFDGTGGETYPLFQVLRGHLTLTRLGEEWFNKIGGADPLTHRQLADLTNKIVSAGLRSLATVAEIPQLEAPRDPITGERLQKGGGNCPACHTGTMREIHPSPFWHCANCGIIRGGSFNPEPQARHLVKNSLEG